MHIKDRRPQPIGRSGIMSDSETIEDLLLATLDAVSLFRVAQLAGTPCPLPPPECTLFARYETANRKTLLVDKIRWTC